MKPRECFGVVVRAFGLLLVLASLFYFVGAVAAGILPQPRSDSMAVYFIVLGGIMMLVGLYLLRGAPSLLRYSYREDKVESDSRPGNA